MKFKKLKEYQSYIEGQQKTQQELEENKFDSDLVFAEEPVFDKKRRSKDSRGSDSTNIVLEKNFKSC